MLQKRVLGENLRLKLLNNLSFFVVFNNFGKVLARGAFFFYIDEF